MKKYIKVPSFYTTDEPNPNIMQSEGCTVIDFSQMATEGTMFLEDHLLVATFDGSITLHYGEELFVIQPRQAILLQKAISVRYKITTVEEQPFRGLLVSINDDFLKEILHKEQTKLPRLKKTAPCNISDLSNDQVDLLSSFTQQINSPNQEMVTIFWSNFIKSSEAHFLRMVFLLRPSKSNVQLVVREHYASPINLPEMAYLSGRSLSSFKRDFKGIYKVPPAQWIRERRLEKAKELLRKTRVPIYDICYSLGFENPTHFSRLYKKHFGLPPIYHR